MPQNTVITKNLDFELWTANTIEGAEGETPLYVANFEGEEAISDLYRFHLKLVCENAEVNFDDIVGHEAGLKVRRGDHAKWYHGLIIDMEQLHQGTKWTHYRATLVPRLWKLSVNHRSRVFPDMTVPEILKKVLEDNGFVDKDDFIIQTNATYQKREFCIQYKETDLNFIRRLMEYEGIYFHFSEHTSAVDTAKPPEKEVLHIIDDRSFEEEIQYDEESHYTDALIYKPDTGAMMSETERVTHFNVRQQVVTTGVRLLDYDHGDLKSEATAELTESGPVKGTYYEHGQFYRGSRTKVTNDGEPFARSLTNEDPVKTHDDERKDHIKRIAQVRQEEFKARHKVMHGQSSSPGLQAGWRFKLMDHYRSDINEKQYLVTSVQHEGAQRGQIPGLGALEEVGYGNSFSCILEGIQYRPPRETPKPKIPGIMTASVESEDGSDDPPNIDEEGRYRVRLPFDLRDQGGGPDPDMADLGKASAPLSMGQPYTGPDYGMHFPNRAGTKMIFACMEGDPDQPVGLSTLPTPWNHTPVPNNKLMMPTQNGVELDFDGDGDKEFSFGSAASFSTTEGGWQPGTMGGKQTFDERKAVIRTRRGHQLVMDDNDASGNVGITLQVGKSDSEGGFGLTQNWFWNSRVDMGGYKKKTSLEQVLDTASFAGEWLGVLASSFGDVPGLAGAVGAALASQAVTGDYLADSLGDTNPVGVAINTDRSVDIQGQDGVNIVSPNILGVLGGGMIPGLSSQGAHRLLWAFTNFLINTIYNGVVKAGAQKYRKYQKYKADPENAASHWYWQYRMDQKAEFAKDTVNSFIQRPGINLKSAGEIKGFAFDDVHWAAGLGSVNLNAGDEINFNADGDMNVEAGQGISIHTAGLKKTKLSASIADNIKTFFGKALPAPLKAIAGRLKVEPEDPAGAEKRMDNFPISIHNEYGNVQAFTDWKHILLRAAKGRVQLAAMTNAVEVMSGDHLYLATGAMGKVKDEDADTGEAEWKSWQLDKDKISTEIMANHQEEAIIMEAGKAISLHTGEMKGEARTEMERSKYTSAMHLSEGWAGLFGQEVSQMLVKDPDNPAASVEVTPDDIRLLMGQSASIILKKNGDIAISGKNVDITASSAFKVNGTSVDVSASGTANYSASMINHKAGMIKQGKGAGKPAAPKPPPRGKKVEKSGKVPKSKKNPKG